MFYASWLWDIVFGAVMAISLVLLIMSAIAKKKNSFDKEDSKKVQESNPLTVVFYFQEDNLPQTESLLYADDCFDLLLNGDEFLEVSASSVPADSDELVACYVPGREIEPAVKRGKDLEDTDPEEFFRKDDELDDMACRLHPRKDFVTPDQVYDLPTATKPIWEQNNSDDFNDMNDLMQ